VIVIHVLWIFALVFGGPLAGMSFDQLFKQLPARRLIGMSAFSAYSRAADLRNGVWLYTLFGVGAAISGAVFAWTAYAAALRAAGLALGVLSLAHTPCTLRAAPTLFRQKQLATSDVGALPRLFDRFAFWHGARCVFQAAAFLNLLEMGPI
jgi:hypothetical protein